MARRIALLGAGSTGKTTLAQALAGALRGRGLQAVAVGEALREWCERTGPAPDPAEQLAIAQEQERRVDAACAQADIVIADTTALMVAMDGRMLHEDGALYRFAIARQRAYDATLVTGLDIAWSPDLLHRDAARPREPLDALLRAHLQRHGIAFQVVYGQGPQRLQSALQALAAAGVLPPAAHPSEADETGGAGQPWVWLCDKCSDPGCEHRLFRRLREAQP